MSTSTPGNRIDFIHTLRGVAPLLVLWAHLGGWWLAAAGIEFSLQTFWDQAFSPALRLYQHGGHLGVLIFFLVSGFVITHVSLRETPLEFVIKRVFRLWPTLILAVFSVPLLQIIATKLELQGVLGSESSKWWQGIFFFNYFVGQPQILTVLWTLFVEIIFYTLTLLLIGKTRAFPGKSTWIILGVVHALNILSFAWPAAKPSMWGTMYVPFLLVGRVAYFYWNKSLRISEALLLGLACYISFLIVYECTSPGVLFAGPTEPVLSHFYALLGFFILMMQAEHRTGRALSFIADISYPLYLLHVPFGSVILFYLHAHGVTYAIALPITVILVILLSWGVHRNIEIPLQGIGRILCRWLRPPVR